MTKDHARKNTARSRQDRAGSAYTSANANTLHDHPGPRFSTLAGAAFETDHDADMSKAAALLAARLAACEPCQKRLTTQILKGDLLVLAALAANLPPIPPPGVRSGTRTIYPVLSTGSGVLILGIIGAMPRRERADLLADAIDHWADLAPTLDAAAASPEQADPSRVIIDLGLPSEPPRADGDPPRIWEFNFTLPAPPPRPAGNGPHEHSFALAPVDLASYRLVHAPDMAAAAALVGAVADRCGDCQGRLFDDVLDDDPILLAELARTVYSQFDDIGETASPAARSFFPRVRQAGQTGDAEPLLAAIEGMDHDHRSDLLNEALDFWAFIVRGADLSRLNRSGRRR
ncbi:hypothetical protein [Streptomyces sp. SAI-090]|jgi:hypothetical protein|uniref:hypothetical protein n=1 Tax=Streptomyces sp. SAI-090 TaxID=2940545 RepID=UPI002476CB15|nr:hypothetical protein [Streptomyces sp. SAI-090]MDH6522091.1 hypothetical protein [Streptomyces sp. SAI-090]